MTALSPKQRQLLQAIKDDAQIRYAGWQQLAVTYGPQGDPRNYVAMQATLYALRDRGLVRLDRDGIHLVDR